MMKKSITERVVMRGKCQLHSVGRGKGYLLLMELVLLKSGSKRTKCLKVFKKSDVRFGRAVVG